MKTYYINEIPTKSEDCRIVGLFTQENWDGLGSFGGWYATEFYTDTTLLACFSQDTTAGRISSYKDKYDCFSEVNQHYDKIEIGSIYRREAFKAASDYEAIEIFKTQSWVQSQVN